MLINLIELSISAALVGIIWIVQLVHYPSFHHYNEKDFRQSMKFHQDRISFIVLPLMISEIAISGWLTYAHYSQLRFIGFLIVILIWTCTFTIQVPIHENLLANGYDKSEVNKLVNSNWIRTFLWTIKLALVISILI